MENLEIKKLASKPFLVEPVLKNGPKFKQTIVKNLWKDTQKS